MLLVTGGAGFIGSHFVDSWLAGGGSVANFNKQNWAGSRGYLATLQDRAGPVFVPALDVADRPRRDRRHAPDTVRFGRERDCAPGQPLEAGLVQTLHSYLENRSTCRAVATGRTSRGGPEELVLPLLQT